MPPITAMASGCSICEPAPQASASGIMPATVASAVIMMGRSRRSPARIMLSSARQPFRAEPLVGVEQQNAVLGHDADHHDQPHERRDVEGGAGDQQRQEDADGGEQRRGEDRDRRGEIAELEQQHGEHQHDRQHQHEHQVLERFLLLFVLRRRTARGWSAAGSVRRSPAAPPPCRRPGSRLRSAP